MYHETKRILQAAGYYRYEISNYAKAGFESKHNSGYWERVPYLGVGLGASSFIRGYRTRNIGDLKQYISLWSLTKIGLHNFKISSFVQDVSISAIENDSNEALYQQYDEIEQLSKEDAMAEYFFLGLRMTRGVSIQQFETQFGCSVFECFSQELQELEKEKLILVDRKQDRIALTEFGMDVSNWVFEKFI